MAAAAVDALGNDPLAAGRWANSRQTLTAMYDMYRNMTTTDAADSPAATITVHQMIRLCGGNDGVLPALLDVVFVLADEVANAAAMFEFSTSAVATLLSEACPTAVDLRYDLLHSLLVALDARLTFADWYRFVLMCVRECRVPVAEKYDRVSFTI
ncbi:unnamed protein product [Macrosiphum euphorbiae]|uniref:Uncharacterized protein n=1 Tax=Macrosiphum euphorbiae TaxID=13131 RepID=A0AAV0VLR6_9HEMI|nr:unnamed protein product [Macrosiphum euphorbiae]